MEGMTSLEREISRLHDELLESPGNIELKLKYGHACLMRDWRLEALRVYQEVLNDEENAAARLALVKIYDFQGYYPEAYGELRKLFAIDPINLQGHIMLHILKEHEPVPEDLVQHCEFVPSLQYLNEQVTLLLKDRDMLDSQIAEYSAMVFGVTEPEPILQYCVMEARKSKERLVKFLAKCDEWSKNAVDSGDCSSDYELYKNVNYSAAADTPASEVPALDKTEIETYASPEDNSSAAAAPAAEPAAEEKAAEAENENAYAEEADVQKPDESSAYLTQEDVPAAADAAVPGAEEKAADAPENAADAPENADAASEPVSAEEKAAEPDIVSQQPQEEIETKGGDSADAPASEEDGSAADTAKLTSLLEPIMNTRGVSRALLYRRGCGVLASVGTAIDQSSTFMAISVGMEAWSSLNSDVNCWILEGTGGMVYIQKLTRDNLLIIDSSSTNLGALRISVDKIVPNLEEAL